LSSGTEAAQIIDELGLQPHPEGGWFREIYRSADRVPGRRGARASVTSIYYLLEHHQISRWHVVEADEIWHFYRGTSIELLAYAVADRQLIRHRLSSREPAAVIPRGVWQAARPLGPYVLVGCSVAPGFEFEDFQFVSELPGHRDHFQSAMADLSVLL
jgi:predicted cupin superfamily sugar epimerase